MLSDRSPYSCGYEVRNDGTAKPRPLPESIRSLADPIQRQDAEAAWEAASRGSRLIDQSHVWFLHLKTTGDADPGFAICLNWSIWTCVNILCTLGFDDRPEGEIITLFPQPPSGNLKPPWQEDLPWIRQTSERLRHLTPIQGNLSTLLRSLEATPGPPCVVALRAAT
jgi:hypothetical protein